MKNWFLLVSAASALSFGSVAIAKDDTDSTVGVLIQNKSPVFTFETSNGKDDDNFVGVRGSIPVNDATPLSPNNGKYLNEIPKKSNIEFYGQVDVGYSHYSK